MSINMNNVETISIEHQQVDSYSTNKSTPDTLLMTGSFASNTKGKKGLDRLLNATGYSIDGFRAAYKFEAAFRQVLWLNLLLFTFIIFIPFAVNIKMMLVFASFLSLIVELINTGIEASVDHTSTEQHPLAKIAKDVGSAAQFLALLLLFVLWLMALSTFLS